MRTPITIRDLVKIATTTTTTATVHATIHHCRDNGSFFTTYDSWSCFLRMTDLLFMPSSGSDRFAFISNISMRTSRSSIGL